MTKFRKKASCGLIEIYISVQNDEYSVRSEMAFDSCAVYTFIGDMITRTLNSGESPSKLVEELKKYKCQKGPVGCIQVIGECLEEFLG